MAKLFWRKNIHHWWSLQINQIMISLFDHSRNSSHQVAYLLTNFHLSETSVVKTEDKAIFIYYLWWWRNSRQIGNLYLKNGLLYILYLQILILLCLSSGRQEIYVHLWGIEHRTADGEAYQGDLWQTWSKMLCSELREITLDWS